MNTWLVGSGIPRRRSARATTGGSAGCRRQQRRGDRYRTGRTAGHVARLAARPDRRADHKLDASPVLADLDRKFSVLQDHKTTDRHVRKIHASGHRDVIAEKCFAYTTNCGGLSLTLYDVTTLYFEAQSEDRLRKIGYSKERRVDPQIVVGLLIDRTGFPLEIGCFEGDTAETTTIRADHRQLPGTPQLGRDADGRGCRGPDALGGQPQSPR